MSPLRVMLVDDFKPFRKFLCETLEKLQNVQVVSEVSDGLDAVQKASELNPDVILLDIGLPSLNGIEAARQIRKVAPESKIIFLSQESSPAVVEDCLNLGALGYVVKMYAGRELLKALEAVCHGMRFVSDGLTTNTTTSSTRPVLPILS